MAPLHHLSDAQIRRELGDRVTLTRTARNLRQRDLAERAGVSVSTLKRIENGDGATLDNFIAVLRSLQALDGLDAILPEPPPRPSDVLAGERPRRQRARLTRTSQPEPWGDEA